MESDIYFLPSEVARLVLGYLKENGYTTTYKSFLKECPHLVEYTSMLKKGRHFPLTIMGISLIAMVQEYAELKLKATQDGQWSQPVGALWKQFESLVKALKQATKIKAKQIGGEMQNSRTYKAILRKKSGVSPQKLIQTEQEVQSPKDMTDSENVFEPTPVKCASVSNTNTSTKKVSTYMLRSKRSTGTCSSASYKDKKSQISSINLSPSDDNTPQNSNDNDVNANNLIDEYGDVDFSSDVNYFSNNKSKKESTKVYVSDTIQSTVMQSEVVQQVDALGQSVSAVWNREKTDGGLDYLRSENICHSTPVLQRKATELRTRKTTSPLTSPIKTSTEIPIPAINLFSSATTCFGSLRVESDNQTTPQKRHPFHQNNIDNEGHAEQTISPWSPSVKSPRRKRHPPKKWKDDISATVPKPVTSDPSIHQTDMEEIGAAENTNTSLALPQLFEKILNDTKLHEKLAETINVRFLESKSCHNTSHTHEETKTKTPKSTAPSIIVEDTMDQILKKPATMSEETIDEIIHMATTDPIFDSLFKTFDTDKNEYIAREYGRNISITEENSRPLEAQEVDHGSVHLSGDNPTSELCAADVAHTSTEYVAVTTLQTSAPSPCSMSGDSRTSTVSSLDSQGQTFKKKPRRIKPTPCGPPSAGFALASPQSPWSLTIGSVPSPAFAQATEQVITRSQVVTQIPSIGQSSQSTATANEQSTAGQCSQSISTVTGNQIPIIGQGSQSISTVTGNQIPIIGQCSQSISTVTGNQIPVIGQGSQSIFTVTGSQILTIGHGSQSISTVTENQIPTIGQGSQSISTVTENQIPTIGQGSQSISTNTGTQIATAGQCILSASTATRNSTSSKKITGNPQDLTVYTNADSSAVTTQNVDQSQYSCHTVSSQILPEQSVSCAIQSCADNTVSPQRGGSLTATGGVGVASVSSSPCVLMSGVSGVCTSVYNYLPSPSSGGQNEDVGVSLKSGSSQYTTIVDASQTDSSVVLVKPTLMTDSGNVSGINSTYSTGSSTSQYLPMPDISHADISVVSKPTLSTQSANVEGISDINNTGDSLYETCSVDNVAFYQPIRTGSVSYGPSKTVLNSPVTSSESFLNRSTLPLVFSPSSTIGASAVQSLQTVTPLPGSILSGSFASQNSSPEDIQQKKKKSTRKTSAKKTCSQPRRKYSKSKKTKAKPGALDISSIPITSSALLAQNTNLSVQNSEIHDVVTASVSDMNVISLSTPQKALDNAFDFNQILTLSPGGQTFTLTDNGNWNTEPIGVVSSTETPSKLNTSVLSNTEFGNYSQTSAQSPTVNQSVVLSSVVNSQTGSIYLKITSPANPSSFKWPNILSKSCSKTPTRGQPSAVLNDGYFMSLKQSGIESSPQHQETFIAVPICKKPDLINTDTHVRTLSFDSSTPIKRSSPRLQTKESLETPIQKIRSSSRLKNFCIRTMDFGVENCGNTVMPQTKPSRKGVTMVKTVPPKSQNKSSSSQLLELTVASPNGKKSTVMSLIDKGTSEGIRQTQKKKGGKSVKTLAEKKQGLPDSLPAKLPIKRAPQTQKAPKGLRAIKPKPTSAAKPMTKGRQKKTQSAKITETAFSSQPKGASFSNSSVLKPACLANNTVLKPTCISTENQEQFTKIHAKTVVSNSSSYRIGSSLGSYSTPLSPLTPGKQEEEAAWTLASFSTSNILADAMREANINAEDAVLLSGMEERSLVTSKPQSAIPDGCLGGNDSVIVTSNDSVRATSNDSVIAASKDSVIATSKDSVTSTANYLVTAISKDSETSANDLVGATSKDSVVATSNDSANDLVRATSKDSVAATSKDSVTTSKEYVSATKSVFVAATLNNTVEATSNDFVATSDNSIRVSSKDSGTASSNNSVTATSSSFTTIDIREKTAAKKSLSPIVGVKEQTSTTCMPSSVCLSRLKEKPPLTAIRKPVCPVSLMGKLSVKAIPKPSGSVGRLKEKISDKVSLVCSVNEKQAKTAIKKSGSLVCSVNEKTSETNFPKPASLSCSVGEKTTKSDSLHPTKSGGSAKEKTAKITSDSSVGVIKKKPNRTNTTKSKSLGSTVTEENSGTDTKACPSPHGQLKGRPSATGTPRSSKKRHLVDYSTDEGSLDSTGSFGRKKRKLNMKTASVDKLLSILHKL